MYDNVCVYIYKYTYTTYILYCISTQTTRWRPVTDLVSSKRIFLVLTICRAWWTWLQGCKKLPWMLQESFGRSAMALERTVEVLKFQTQGPSILYISGFPWFALGRWFMSLAFVLYLWLVFRSWIQIDSSVRRNIWWILDVLNFAIGSFCWPTGGWLIQVQVAMECYGVSPSPPFHIEHFEFDGDACLQFIGQSAKNRCSPNIRNLKFLWQNVVIALRHQGVVVECKSSLSALQQILDSKDCWWLILTPKIIWTFQLKMLWVGNWIWVKIRGSPEEDSPERQVSTASCSYWVCDTRTARTKSPCNWDLFSSSNGKKISRSGFKIVRGSFRGEILWMSMVHLMPIQVESVLEWSIQCREGTLTLLDKSKCSA